MYSRLLNPVDHSYLLFGPRGTGKTTFLRTNYPDSLYLDLLDTRTYTNLLTQPANLASLIPPGFKNFIILDEIQRIPELLNEVHRLIEGPDRHRFILTGSSARRLRTRGVNLLAGRAYTSHIYPLIASELGRDFDLSQALRYGTLPSVITSPLRESYLNSYLHTYVEQEIKQEGLIRSLPAFYRFLPIAALSSGNPLNTSAIAREVGVHAKVVENYFSILVDLLLGSYLPAWTRRAKRRLLHHPKFYFVDCGLYQTARPRGILDTSREVGGVALETLFLTHLRAVNEYARLGYDFYYYNTASGQEIDFVAYGPKGFHAFEIKSSSTFQPSWTRALKSFGRDYPEAKLHLVYGGNLPQYHGNILVHPMSQLLTNLSSLLSA